MFRSIAERAEDILEKLPPDVAKGFKPKEHPAMHIAKRVLHQTEKGLRMENCHLLPSGVHVCEAPSGKFLSAYYCSNWKGKTRADETREKAYSRHGCMKELEIRYFDGSAYIRWVSARPRLRGHGKAFWKEIRAFLEKKKCVKRVTLQSLGPAEGFYESLDFVPLIAKGHEGKWTDEKYRYMRHAMPLRPEDKEWIWEHPEWKPYEFVLHPRYDCQPKGPVPVTKVGKYIKKWHV